MSLINELNKLDEKIENYDRQAVDLKREQNKLMKQCEMTKNEINKKNTEYLKIIDKKNYKTNCEERLTCFYKNMVKKYSELCNISECNKEKVYEINSTIDSEKLHDQNINV